MNNAISMKELQSATQRDHNMSGLLFGERMFCSNLEEINVEKFGHNEECSGGFVGLDETKDVRVRFRVKLEDSVEKPDF